MINMGGPAFDIGGAIAPSVPMEMPGQFTSALSGKFGATSVEVKVAAGTLVFFAFGLVGFYVWTRNHQL